MAKRLRFPHWGSGHYYYCYIIIDIMLQGIICGISSKEVKKKLKTYH